MSRIDHEPFPAIEKVVLLGEPEAYIGHPPCHLLLTHVHLTLIRPPVSTLYDRDSAFRFDVA